MSSLKKRGESTCLIKLTKRAIRYGWTDGQIQNYALFAQKHLQISNICVDKKNFLPFITK